MTFGSCHRAGGSVLLLLALHCACLGRAAELYVRRVSCTETMLASRAALTAAGLSEAERTVAAEALWLQLKEDFPVEWDWLLQDGGTGVAQWFGSTNSTALERQLNDKALEELAIKPGDSTPADGLLSVYLKACEQRRQQRLKALVAKTPRVVFTKHRTVRPSFFAYTEGLSDAQDERHFLPGSELCLLELEGTRAKVRTLVSDPTGAIRDPAVSWDAQRVLFAWKKSLNEDDYHIYELDMASNVVRQITSGLGFADYEPAYLPGGDVIFSSTRCVQTVDCFWTEASNLYTCDPDGRFLRRLGFDQVHTVYPQVLDDGRVIYTRWDYNDRGQVFTQALFQMNADGTGQSEFYGNNSWFPTTIAHARGIPGTEKVLAILCGHHTAQAGKLAVIDPARGRQEAEGVQLVAPVRATAAEHTDQYGQAGELWQYPYPLNEQECLVTYAPMGWERSVGARRARGLTAGKSGSGVAAAGNSRAPDADFGIYWMDLAGRRELLASDPRLPCNQPVPLTPRPRPLVWANRVDYNDDKGTFYVQDVYAGPGLTGVPRGTVRKLRVVTFETRAAGIGSNRSQGPAGAALASTPVSIGNGAWDVKVVLGDARVYEDGSALFVAPARRPLYFQALDEHGRAVQTMRSWTTLQPGEYAGCVGCHEEKNAAPPAREYAFSLAMKAGPQKLEPFYGPARGFSFAREIQPILDRQCIRCHKDRAPIQRLASGELRQPPLSRPRQPGIDGDGSKDQTAFSLLGELTVDPVAKRRWSDAYLILTQAALGPGEAPWQGNCQGRLVNWIGAQSVPSLLPPYAAGASRSELLPLLEKGHRGVQLSREELDKIACWIDLLVPYCGDYREANAWTEAEMRKYERYAEKRRSMEELEQQSIDALLGRQEPARGRGPGRAMIPRG